MLNKIAEKRKECGYSQKELAQLVGISTTYLSKLENSKKNLTWIMAARIAEKLNCSAKDLFF